MAEDEPINTDLPEPLGEMDTLINTTSTTMEVHHHPDLHHKPKPWKEYFFEYLMIVLAVTSGFFAERLREYQSDRAKERELVVTIYRQVSADSARLNYLINDYLLRTSTIWTQ